MADQVRVFVSHHHSPEEDAFTARLVADLEAAGADVWVDTSGITSDDFVKKISEGLAGRQWLVLVMTPGALKSPWVQREVNVALNEHTAGRMLGVLPLVMQTCHEPTIPMLWRTLHRYDATHDYPTARDGLLRALGLKMPAPALPPQPELASLTQRASEPVRSVQPDPVRPVSPAPAQPSIPPNRFPPRLASLGYQARIVGGVEVIIPPLCDVPAGAFLMGSDPKKDKAAQYDEQPRHRINLRAYQIGRYPVTVAEYACFVRGSKQESHERHNLLANLDHPVVYISWYDATDYADWLADLTGQPWRLPTEAEWEKAARGTDGRIYPWGDSFDASRVSKPITPVGSYPNGASPCGAQDMLGNVEEWTSSLNKPYPYRVNDGREGSDSTNRRIQRGSSWASSAEWARAAHRTPFHTYDRNSNFGFRLVRAVPS